MWHYQNNRRRVSIVCKLNVGFRCHSISRKLLFPLMKTLHPDMFAQESKTVQSGNISCIQNLNSLWDCIDSLISAMLVSRSNNSNSVELRNPFRESYNLSCYVRAITDTKSEIKTKSLSKNEFVMKINPALCSKSSLAMSDAKQHINAIFVQQGKLFVNLGLEDPWSTIKSSEADGSSDKPRGSNNTSQDFSNNFKMTKEMNCALFDRSVILNSRKHANNRSMSNMLGDSNTMYRKGQSLQKKLDLRAVQAEVDQYIAVGKVKLKGVPIAEEIAAVERARSFLVDYGAVLNFGLDTWSNIVLILLPTHVKPVNAKVVANRTAKSIQPEGADNNREGFTYQTIKVPDKRCIHVVGMPLNFKPRLLLEYMRVHLQTTSLGLHM